MNKNIFAGLVIPAVPGLGGPAIGTATPAAGNAVFTGGVAGTQAFRQLTGGAGFAAFRWHRTACSAATAAGP
jgi:hypothetical protein